MGMTMSQNILVNHATLEHVDVDQLIKADLDMVIDNMTKNTSFSFSPYPQFILKMICANGYLNAIKEGAFNE